MKKLILPISIIFRESRPFSLECGYRIGLLPAVVCYTFNNAGAGRTINTYRSSS